MHRSDLNTYHSSWAGLDILSGLPVQKCQVSAQLGGRTGLVVRASDSGSGDPGSILGRVGVLFP